MGTLDNSIGGTLDAAGDKTVDLLSAGSASIGSDGPATSFEEIGGLGDIETQTPSGVEWAEFTDLAGANRLKLDLNGLRPSSGAANVKLQVSTDGGSTWEAGTSYHWGAHNVNDGGATGASGQTDDSIIQLTRASAVGASDGQAVSGVAEIHAIGDTDSFTYVVGDMSSVAGTGSFLRTYAGGVYTATTTVDAVRVGFINAATIAGGSVTLSGGTR